MRVLLLFSLLYLISLINIYASSSIAKMEYFKSPARNTINKFELILPVVLEKCLDIRGGENSVNDIINIKYFVSFFRKIYNNFFSLLSKKKKRSKAEIFKNAEKVEKSGGTNARIQKEIRSFMSNPPDNCKLSIGSNIRIWIVTITGADGTIYAGEKYKLKMVFPKEYPTKPPGVYFLKPVPKHQHVYTNGDICLNLLGRDWRPTMTAQNLAVSILSMLSNAKEKKMPIDNAMHADAPPGQQQDNWMYHDDKC